MSKALSTENEINTEALMNAVRNLKASQAARYGVKVRDVTVNDLTNLQLGAYLACASALNPSDVLTEVELAAYQPKIVLDAISRGFGR